MRRRAVLAGSAAALAGAGLLVDTGSFSSIETERDIMIDVVSDENAFLRLEYPSQPIDCEGEFQLVEIQNRTGVELTSVVVSIERAPDEERLDPTGEIAVVDGQETLGTGEAESVTLTADEEFTGTGEIAFDVSARGDGISIDTTELRTVDIDCSQATAGGNETGTDD